MNPERLTDLLRDVRSGTVSVEAALRRLRTLPFEDLGFASLDHHRSIRQGFPEVLFCEGKTDAQILGIARSLLRRKGPFLATRIGPRAARALCRLNRRATYFETARVVAVSPTAKARHGHVLRVLVLAAPHERFLAAAPADQTTSPGSESQFARAVGATTGPESSHSLGNATEH